MADAKRDRDQNLGAELRLLDYRNLRWVPKIVGLIKSGIPTSIVVGTGHLCGTNSVIDLLQKRVTKSSSSRSRPKAQPRGSVEAGGLDRVTSSIAEVKRVHVEAAVYWRS
jgi:hypothetical protein